MSLETEFFEISTRHWRAKLAISIDIMRELSRYNDPDEMYRVFAYRMNQIYPTTRQLTISRRSLVEPEYHVLRSNLWSDAVESTGEHRSEHPRLTLYSGGILSDLLYREAPQVIDCLDYSANEPAAEFLEAQRSLLAIPLFESGDATTMLILTREETNAFAREQVPELVWMANLFTRALHAQMLTRQLTEAYQNAQYEQKVIAELQKSLLPATIPSIRGLDLAAFYRAAGRVGGDYYDFFPLSNGRLGILIADVSGHGSPAAVLMAITHSLAHSYQQLPEQPDAFLAYLNHELARRYTVTSGNFITAFYMVVDPAQQTITYANAGHVVPRMIRDDNSDWEPLPNHERLPLGINSRKADYTQQTVPFTDQTQIILLTDGIVESTNQQNERFGFRRLLNRKKSRTDSAQWLLASILAAWEGFTGDQPVTDDCTLLVLCGRSSE